jgi:hypothetical protein
VGTENTYTAPNSSSVPVVTVILGTNTKPHSVQNPYIVFTHKTSHFKIIPNASIQISDAKFEVLTAVLLKVQHPIP